MRGMPMAGSTGFQTSTANDACHGSCMCFAQEACMHGTGQSLQLFLALEAFITDNSQSIGAAAAVVQVKAEGY